MKLVIYVCFFAILLSSCTTSDNDQDPQNPESNFYALTLGNEWVYKNYKYNSTTQTYDDTGVIDSVSVVGTEVVGTNTYFNFRRFTTGNVPGNPSGEYFELLRDSLGYLVRDDGSIKYANNDFTARVLSEAEWGNVYDQLISTNNEITVEAGTFVSTYTQRYAILSNGEQSNGLDHYYYVDGIGLIYDTTSLVSQDIPLVIRRLDSYTVD